MKLVLFTFALTAVSFALSSGHGARFQKRHSLALRSAESASIETTSTLFIEFHQPFSTSLNEATAESSLSTDSLSQSISSAPGKSSMSEPVPRQPESTSGVFVDLAASKLPTASSDDKTDSTPPTESSSSAGSSETLFSSASPTASRSQAAPISTGSSSALELSTSSHSPTALPTQSTYLSSREGSRSLHVETNASIHLSASATSLQSVSRSTEVLGSQSLNRSSSTLSKVPFNEKTGSSILQSSATIENLDNKSLNPSITVLSYSSHSTTISEPTKLATQTPTIFKTVDGKSLSSAARSLPTPKPQVVSHRRPRKQTRKSRFISVGRDQRPLFTVASDEVTFSHDFGSFFTTTTTSSQTSSSSSSTTKDTSRASKSSSSKSSSDTQTSTTTVSETSSESSSSALQPAVKSGIGAQLTDSFSSVKAATPEPSTLTTSSASASAVLTSPVQTSLPPSTSAIEKPSQSSSSSAGASAAADLQNAKAVVAAQTGAAFQLPGRSYDVLPIGLGIVGGLATITMLVVGFMTYQRLKYRKQYRARKMVEAATYGTMREVKV